jgi:hypothetical protein
VPFLVLISKLWGADIPLNILSRTNRRFLELLGFKLVANNNYFTKSEFA